MEIRHQGFAAILDDEWWIAGEMEGFVPHSRAYTTGDAGASEIRIADIGPLPEARRARGIFRENEDEKIPARDRVLKILRGLRLGESVPPIVVKDSDPASGFAFELADGTHRLHLSIAAGFTHIPAVKWE